LSLSAFHFAEEHETIGDRVIIIQDKTQKGTLPVNELDALLTFLDSGHWRDAFKELELTVLREKEDWFCNMKRGDYEKLSVMKEKLQNAGLSVTIESN